MNACDTQESYEHGKVYNSLMNAESYLDSHLPRNVNWNRVFIFLWLFLIVLNATRLFYNIFWWDECYSILLSHKPIDELMYETEYHDANPPLYYLLLKLFYTVIGFEPFVYNFVSFIPYFLSMVLIITVVKKRLGLAPAAILMLFASILEPSQYYMTEARAYEWAFFFLFAMGVLCYEIIVSPKISHYILITIVYICACYTHYYALMCGGLILVGLIMRSIVKKDKNNTILSSASLLVSFLAFIPWIPYFMKESNDITTNFWIEGVPDIVECVNYIFGYNPVSAIFTFFLIVTVIYLIKIIGKTKRFDDFLSLFENGSEKWSFIFIGLLAVFGVIFFMTGVSIIKSPVLYTRYIFPFSSMVWMIMAIFLSGTRLRKLFTILILCVLLAISIPLCSIWMVNEHQTGIETTDTLNVTLEEMKDGDIILTDQYNIVRYEWEYYYPMNPFVYIYDGIIPDLSPDSHYWLFLDKEITTEMMTELSDKGYTAELLKENGRITYHTLQIYQIVNLP